jgi:hypothetical protein
MKQISICLPYAQPLKHLTKRYEQAVVLACDPQSSMTFANGSIIGEVEDGMTAISG